MPDQSRPQLVVEPRVRVRKKSEIRHLRRMGQIPALVYGHGDPEAIKVSARSVSEYLRHHTSGGILDLSLTDQMTPVLIREIDRDPVSGQIIHLGFQRVDMQERLKTTIPLEFIGEESLIQDQLVLQRQMSELEVHARADQLPEAIVVDVSGVAAGHSLRIEDLQLPEGIEPTKDPSQLVVSVTHPSVPSDVGAALEAEEAARVALVEAHAGEAAEEEEEVGEAAAT